MTALRTPIASAPEAEPKRSAPNLRRATLRERAVAGLVAFGALSVLALAAWLRPSPQGHGTHEQLDFLPGMGPCVWAATTNKPCPTCGMTTAFAWAAEGDLAQSAATQPFAALLAVLTAAAFWAGLHIAVTGSRLGRVFAGLLSPPALWTGLALLLAAWAYKAMVWPGA